MQPAFVEKWVGIAIFRGKVHSGGAWKARSESDLKGEQTPLWRRLLNGWMTIAARFGGVQTQLILVLFYVALIGPISILQALGRRDQLDKREMWKQETAWRNSDTGGTDLERAKLLS